MRKRKKIKKCIICKEKIDIKHGKYWICKVCYTLPVRKSHLISVYNRKNIKIAYKICVNCGVKKRLRTEFGKRRGDHHRWYNSWCLECRRKYNRKYREKNKEKAIAYSREYRRKEGYKERNAAYMREYRKRRKLT